MKSSWLSLGIVLVILAFAAGCGGAQQSPAVPEEVPPPPEAPVVEVPPEPEVPEVPEVPEFDIEPFYEGEMMAMEEPVPPPRVVESTEPPAMEGEIEEEYSAAVDAPPQPMAAAPDFEIVYFDYDKSNIKPEFESAIRDNAQKLRDDTTLVVIIEGHCDERGTTEYNLALGQRRADSVRNALISEGVSADQLDTVSYGEERPVAYGSDEASWSQNRRGVITIR
jgi:peptidoglycan-associated lipoprotein